MRRSDIRNIAIIAHVDHGKTTLVDAMLRQSGLFRESQLVGEQILDTGELERERGITILAKNIALPYQGVKINLIDTPGHADFSGEVERTVQMADGALVVVDSFEGPMPQTRYVLRKALAAGVKPIVVINKVDRPDARPKEVLHEVFDLFVELGADEHALEFPYLFASGKEGYASRDPDRREGTIQPLLDLMLSAIPGPEVEPGRALQMLVTTLDYSDYVGQIAIGRIVAGRISAGQKVAVTKADGSLAEGSVVSVEVFEKLGRTAVESAEAGDIVAIIGLEGVNIADTIADPEQPVALPRMAVDEPTLSMVFRINDSPMSGREGRFLTSRHIRDRLERELRTNVALRLEPMEDSDAFLVSGRGLLHLSILIETMRREGFELSIGKPYVIVKQIDGAAHEPFEYLVIDVPREYMGGVMELVGDRRGEVAKMDTKANLAHMEFTIPARSLIGLRTRLLSATAGEVIMHHNFHSYQPMRGEVPHRANGVMVATAAGKAAAYAIDGLQERGVLFVAPGREVYEGMIVGENSRGGDMTVNITKGRKLTNMRAATADAKLILKAPRDLTLELALEYIEDDELVEVTPGSIGLRKKLLREEDRKRQARRQRQAVEQATA